MDALEREIATLFERHQASQAAPLGPWYCAEIRIAKGASLPAHYHWEGTPVRSMAELKVHGLSVPLHPFKRGLPASLLREWPERLLADAIDTFVIAQSQRGGAVATPVLEVFALLTRLGVDEWQEQADLDDRFFEVSSAMQERLCEYIRANADALATDATSQR